MDFRLRWIVLFFLIVTFPNWSFYQEKMHSEFISVNGLDLHYDMKGEGDPLLLLHGWTQSTLFWEPYVDFFSEAYHVYSIDLRGHGRSGTLTEDFSIQLASRDIEQLIKELGLKNVHAIGLSYGGLILLEIAVREKKLIDKMVLIGVSNRFDGKENQKGKPSVTYDSIDDSFKHYMELNHPFGTEQINALFNPDLDYIINISENQLKDIKTELLIINGDSDEIVGIDGAVKIFRNTPFSNLWIIPNSGHIPIKEENRDEFQNRISQFFNE
jgi:pimeloyl-ACP methyl ester carboxylesterase